MENEICMLDVITAMTCMNNDYNYHDNPTLNKEIVNSLRWFTKHNDILKLYYLRQIKKDFDEENND